MVIGSGLFGRRTGGGKRGRGAEEGLDLFGWFAFRLGEKEGGEQDSSHAETAVEAESATFTQVTLNIDKSVKINRPINQT